MPSKKVELGHKPNVNEIEKVVNTFEKIATHNINRYSDNLKKKLEDQELKESVIGFAMACGVSNVAKLLKKFIDTGVIMNPLDDGNEENNFNTDKVFEEFVKDGKEANKDDDENENKTEGKRMLNNMDEDDITEAYKIIDRAYKKAAVEVVDKFGKKNAVELLCGYAEAFLNMADDWDKDDDELDFSKEHLKQVDAKEALKEMRKDGLGDLADAIETLINKSGDAEVKVFKGGKKNR